MIGLGADILEIADKAVNRTEAVECESG